MGGWITMTYGDKIRQMDDDQLATLLFIVQYEGQEICEGITIYRTFYPCETYEGWLQLIQREIPDGAPRFGVM